MTGPGPTSSREQDRPPSSTVPDGPRADLPAEEYADAGPTSSAAVRAAKLNAANMVRSMLPLILICLALVGWVALRQTPEDPVTEVDPSSAVRLAAERAAYPVLVPEGLPEGYRPTSARTDAGSAAEGDAVTLEIGYFTPGEEFAGFVIGDDPRARALRTVLDGAEESGTVEIAGETWARSTTADGETALVQESGEVTVVVTGSADEEELTEVAAAVGPV